MRMNALGWAVVLVAAAGCGSSTSNSATCDNLATALTGLSTKYAPCGSSRAITFDKNACVQAFNNSACSDADRKKINDYADCLSELPTCSTATQASWVISLTNCEAKLQGISSNC